MSTKELQERTGCEWTALRIFSIAFWWILFSSIMTCKSEHAGAFGSMRAQIWQLPHLSILHCHEQLTSSRSSLATVAGETADSNRTRCCLSQQAYGKGLVPVATQILRIVSLRTLCSEGWHCAWPSPSPWWRPTKGTLFAHVLFKHRNEQIWLEM